MRGQVGVIFSSTNNSNKNEIFMFTGTGIITQCTTEQKKIKIQTMLALSSINFY